MNLGAFAPILALLVLVVLFAVLSLLVSSFLRPRHPTRAKASPYESGIEPGKLPAGERYPVRFYLTAMLFVVFDIEVIFLYPWAVIFRELRLFGLVQMGIFIALVLVAYVYDWKRGGLDWSTSHPVHRALGRGHEEIDARPAAPVGAGVRGSGGSGAPDETAHRGGTVGDGGVR